MTPALPTGSSHVSYTLAALTSFGGLAGYARTRSTRSLAAGLIFGAGYAAAGHFISSGEQTRGFRLGTSVSVALAGLMGYRYFKTRKPMPALLLAGLGASGAVYHGMKWREWSE